MKKYKTVKEVCELTGLNRKLLFDYEKEGIIKPSDYRTRGYENQKGVTFNGHKLYDEVAVYKLQQVAIFRKLGLARSAIKEKMSSKEYDANKVLEEQIYMLKQKQKEIEELLIVAEQLKVIGMKSELSQYYAKVNVSELAQNALRWENSAQAQKFALTLEKEWDNFKQQIGDILDDLLEANMGGCKLDEVNKKIEKLFQVTKDNYGFVGWMTLFVIALSGQGGGDIFSDLDKEVNEDNMVKTFTAIIQYLKTTLDAILENLIDIIVENYDVIGKSPKEEGVRQFIKQIKDMLLNYMGIKNKEEYELLFEFIHMSNIMKDDDIFSYIFEILQNSLDEE